MKRNQVAPSPEESKRKLSCGTALVVLVVGGVLLSALRPRAAQVAVTATVVAAAATIMTNTPDSTGVPSPSATITETSTATITPTYLRNTRTPSPVPTSAPSETWYVVSNANLRSCARTSCDLVTRMEAGTAVTLVGFEQGETVQGSDIWRKVYHNGEVVYVHSSLVSANPPRPTSAPAAQVQIVNPTSAPVQPAQPPAFVPENCAEAVAAGLTAEQAAQWPHLDRDGDGVACYGD